MSAVNRLNVTDVCVRAQRGEGEAQRPALFGAEARRTGGKRAIGTGEDDRISRYKKFGGFVCV